MAWTARAAVQIRTAAGQPTTVAHPFTRFDVLDVDSTGSILLLRCARCAEPTEGWIRKEDLITEPLPLERAVEGSLAEFALALRQSAISRDLPALREVMYRDFTFSFGGGGGPADAFSRWRHEGYRSLEALPALLDHGLATDDGVLWAAPPAFLADEDFRGLRAGFRRVENRWEWLYLVRGD
jgi:hypothetical protein